MTIVQLHPTRQQVCSLALRIADHARGLGFITARIETSRNSASMSKYLKLIDGRNQIWIVRVSEHEGRRNDGHARPHFDLITRDGRDGYVPACLWLDRVHSGQVAWRDTLSGVRQPKRRRRA